VLGALITVVFTTANVYFGLKTALSFASSIPAAVIATAVLRVIGSASIQEINIVQTVASAAGALASIVFVLPGLVMVGWWSHFPFWQTYGVCVIGGVLGVTFSIPLRRALVLGSNLPFPEGVACAEVLLIGTADAQGITRDAVLTRSVGRDGLLVIVIGSLTSALYYLVVSIGVFASHISMFFRIGRGGLGLNIGFSLAVYGVGQLVGIQIGLSMLAGIVIAWVGAVPYFLASGDYPSPIDVAVFDVWAHKVRLMGAGLIGVAAVWSLLRLARPVVAGLAAAFASSRERRWPRTGVLPLIEQDLPIGWTMLITVTCLAATGAMLSYFAEHSSLGGPVAALVTGGVVYVLIAGLFVSAISGYMAGLIGSSNSPVSGVGILASLLASVLIVGAAPHFFSADPGPALVAFALFATSFVFAAAVIGNDNLQDLKTGQIVGATPWKQQVALMLGVFAGAAIIPLVLNLLNEAYGFSGMPGVDQAHALAAPQASLIASLVKGVIEGNLDWRLLGVGAAIGIVVIAIDEGLGAMNKWRLSPLATGMGVYLPMGTTLMVVLGAIGGSLFDNFIKKKEHPTTGKQLGVLLASGLIVGEGLIGVIVAGVSVAWRNSGPVVLVSGGIAAALRLFGVLTFVGAVLGLYVLVIRLGQIRVTTPKTIDE